MADEPDIIVIGGGIWGFSTAWHLAKQSTAKIVVCEQNEEPARETTLRAAGLIGQIRPARVMCEAVQYALDLLSGFEDETGHDPGLHRPGSLQVAMTEERMQAFREQVSSAAANGVRAEFVSLQEIQRLAPGIDVWSLRGGYFVEGDGYLDPRRCALAFASAAIDRGVDVRYATRVTGLVVSDRQVQGVTTDKGVIHADRVVITAGPWTLQLAKGTGCDLPLQVIRHQRAVTVPVPGIPSHHPVVRVNDVSCYVRPEQGGYLYGFFEPSPTCIDLAGEPPGFRTADLAVPYETISEARRRLAPVFPVLDQLEIKEYQQGMTTFAPDGKYVIGPVPGAQGLFAASGCAALGIAGAAAIGAWLAESVLTGKPPSALSEFDPQRFGARSADRTWVQQSAADFYANYYNLTPGARS